MPSPPPIHIADDSEDDVVLLKHAFKQLSIANPVYSVHDGDEAVAYLQGKGRFDNREQFPLPRIVFLDLKMPRRNGFEVLAWLKGQQQFNEILTVVLTVRTEMQDVTRAYALGADSFLVKPCLPDEIENLANYYREYWVFSPTRKKPLSNPPPGRSSSFYRSLIFFKSLSARRSRLGWNENPPDTRHLPMFREAVNFHDERARKCARERLEFRTL